MTAERLTPELAESLGAVLLEGIDTEGDADEHLVLVGRAAAGETEMGRLLHQSVGAARAAGHSWVAIGAELGMSRQAVQQRFGDRSRGDDAAEDATEERWLGPVTAFDEMAELEIAGRQGWRTVGAGMLKHRVRRTPTQWEHKRTLWTGPLRRWESEGWEIAVRAFPWVYLVRDLGVPPESD